MAQVKQSKSYYRRYFREIDVLHGLQTPPEERQWLLTAPKGDVKPAKVVLYLGCNVMRTSHLMRTAVDIFKLMGVDFVAVGGAPYCCGIQHFQNGHEKAGLSVAMATVRNFQKFQPERVVMWCPSCIYFYDEIMQMREDFSFQHVTQFLVENLDKLPLRQRVDAKVALHYHTGRLQTDEEAQCGSKLLSMIPGVSLVDLGADLRLGRQCNERGRERLGPQEWDDILSQSFQKAVDAGADVYANLYHGCQRFLCRKEGEYPLRVEHYLTLVGRALGIEHEDLYKKYLTMGDPDAILADTSPCAAASGVTQVEARAAIEKTFVS